MKKKPKSNNTSKKNIYKPISPSIKIDLDLIANPEIVNPLTEITRRTRKYLILTIFISFGITWAGLVPNKISSLGIELTTSNQNAILVLLVFSLAYFIVTFWIYVNTDLIRYKIFHRASKDNLKFSQRDSLLQNMKDLDKYTDELKIKIKNKDYANISKVTPEINAAILNQELIKSPLKLLKSSYSKVLYDKYFPIIIGFTCLIFICIKLLKLPYSNFILICFSLNISLIGFFFLLWFNKKSAFDTYIFKVNSKIRIWYDKLNKWLLGLQLKLTKKNSKRELKLNKLINEFSLKSARTNAEKNFSRIQDIYKNSINGIKKV